MNEEEILQLIRRRFVWDLHSCGDALDALEKMGMVLGSGDVLEREHDAHHAREVYLMPIEEHLHVLCGLAVDVISTTILPSRDAEDILDDLPYLIEASTRAVLSYLLSCRVLRF